MAQTKHLNARDSTAADLLTKQYQAIQSRLQGGAEAKVPINEEDAEPARPPFRAPTANMNATKPSRSAASAVSMPSKGPLKARDSEATRPIMERLQSIQLQPRAGNKADGNDAYSAPAQSQTPVATTHAPSPSKPAQAAAASMPKPKIRPNARDSASADLMKQQWSNNKKFPDVKKSGPSQVIGPATTTHPASTAQLTQTKAGFSLDRAQTFPQANKPTRSKAKATNVSEVQRKHDLQARKPTVPMGPAEIQKRARAGGASSDDGDGTTTIRSDGDAPRPAAAAAAAAAAAGRRHKKGIAQRIKPPRKVATWT